VIAASVKEIPTVKCEGIMPPIANRVPHLPITWDEWRVRITHEKVTRKLAAGDPPIRIGRVSGSGDKGILVSALTLQYGGEEVVARRLGEIFKRAAR
jgi:hypothetical protein